MNGNCETVNGNAAINTTVVKYSLEEILFSSIFAFMVSLFYFLFVR